MKPASFDYHAPATVPEALDLLARLGDARVIAGGQSLAPMLNMRYVVTDNLVDINRIAGLDYIREAGGHVEIGAMTRQRAILESDLLRRKAPIFAEAVRHVGHIQTRNRGTLGGSLCHLDPAAELPVVALLLDAVLTVEGRGGWREVAMADWPAGYMTPALEPGELLTSIRIAPWAEGHGWAFLELARRHGDFAIACAGVLLERGRDGRIARAAIALGGVNTTPVRLGAAEAAVAGRMPSEDVLAGAAEIARGLDAMDDAYTPAPYRQGVAAVLVRRALAQAAARMTART